MLWNISSWWISLVGVTLVNRQLVRHFFAVSNVVMFETKNEDSAKKNTKKKWLNPNDRKCWIQSVINIFPTHLYSNRLFSCLQAIITIKLCMHPIKYNLIIIKLSKRSGNDVTITNAAWEIAILTLKMFHIRLIFDLWCYYAYHNCNIKL